MLCLCDCSLPVDTGVCKINGVVTVVNYCYSSGFSKRSTTNTPFILQTPVLCRVLFVDCLSFVDCLLTEESNKSRSKFDCC